MDYALEFFFDAASDEAVRGLWRCTGDDYLPRVNSRPHVTTGVFSGTDIGGACEALQKAALGIPAFPMVFASVGAFTHPRPWLFLAPVVTDALLALHRRLHAALSFCGEADAHYIPGNWVPHCALAPAQDVRALAGAAGKVFAAFSPFTAQVEEIGWVELSRPVRQVAGVRLPHPGEF